MSTGSNHTVKTYALHMKIHIPRREIRSFERELRVPRLRAHAFYVGIRAPSVQNIHCLRGDLHATVKTTMFSREI